MAYFFTPTTDMDRSRRLAEASVAATASAALNGVPFAYLFWIGAFGSGIVPDMVFLGALAFFAACGLASVVGYLLSRKPAAKPLPEGYEAVEEAIGTLDRAILVSAKSAA